MAERADTAAALKKSKDDAVAANIKILENFYSFVISFALTQATMRLVDSWTKEGIDTTIFEQCVLYFALVITIVPFYQGMNRFLYVTHVIRPLEKPDFRSSPMLLDIYSFLVMSCIIFAMGRFLDNPRAFFYLWSALLTIDIVWSVIVWRVQKSRSPYWAWNNLAWLCIAWAFYYATNLNTVSSRLSLSTKELLPYAFVCFVVLRTLNDYRINWKFYFPEEYKGF